MIWSYVIIMRVFLSYTIRDNEIDVDFLKTLKMRIQETGAINLYVDLLDNNDNDPQSGVLSSLSRADALCIIQTKSIYDSPWVKKEIETAKKSKILIYTISYARAIMISNNLSERIAFINDIQSKYEHNNKPSPSERS